MRSNIKILEATVITVVKYGSEASALCKMQEDLLDFFQRKCLRIGYPADRPYFKQ